LNAPTPGGLITEEFGYDGGRSVTVYVPLESTGSVVFLADGGWHVSALSEALHRAGSRSTLVVGVHGLSDDDGRLHEYVHGFDTARFASHERFFVHEVGQWLTTRFGIELHPERTAVWGASLGGEFALAMGLRHPDVFGSVLACSPGSGFRPPDVMPTPLPRFYFVAGEDEPFFLDNATRWAAALRDHGATVVTKQRPGEHGGSFWADEFPMMVDWAFSH
jgi:enterochelin esterase-like enzyme